MLDEQRVRELVGQCQPRFAPLALNDIDALMVRIHMFSRRDDLLLLRQQCVLAEALAANSRGESLEYLRRK